MTLSFVGKEFRDEEGNRVVCIASISGEEIKRKKEEQNKQLKEKIEKFKKMVERSKKINEENKRYWEEQCEKDDE